MYIKLTDTLTLIERRRWTEIAQPITPRKEGNHTQKKLQ